MTAAFLQARLDEAIACEGQGRLEDAARLYRAILESDPANAVALSRLSAVTLVRGDAPAALALAQAALAADPRFASARVNLGQALRTLGRFDEARAAFDLAVKHAPDFAYAHLLLADTLWKLEKYEPAARSYETAVRLDPAFAAEVEAAQIERLDQADWRGYKTSVDLTVKLTRSGALAMNAVKFMYCTGAPADHQQCGRLTARKNPPRPPLWTGQARREGKIRLGYLTSDFYDHSVAHVAAGFLERHDRDRFELTAFSCSPPYPSPIRERIVAAFDHFENLADADDQAIARLIRERDIDVLVYLSGYAYRARPGVLAWRPAPVQVNFLGYPGTMGAPYVDYLIADRHVIPQDETGFYDEQIVWMPHTYQPTDDKVARSGGSRTRAQENLPQDAFVLMAYHPASKISPAIFAAWMRILARLPGSVLWLQEAPQVAQENLRREAAARKIDPSRLVFSQRLLSRPDHMARHQLADLFIDSLPYNAHSTASDALWAGLPVVTCRGGAFPGRVCAGLLAAAGFPELIAGDLTAYENLIVALASDPARLAALRARVEVEAPQSPLFDTAAYTRHLEAAWQTMYEATQAGRPPASFQVEP